MVNLLEETRRDLELHGKTFDDVKWIELRGKELPVELFIMKADFAYDNGYGSAEIDETLMIVGDGWWLEREEYDGSEWWAFRTAPEKPSEAWGYDIPAFCWEDDEDY